MITRNTVVFGSCRKTCTRVGFWRGLTPSHQCPNELKGCGERLAARIQTIHDCRSRVSMAQCLAQGSFIEGFQGVRHLEWRTKHE